jgi:uncharacterized protein (TIGR03086 family)
VPLTCDTIGHMIDLRPAAHRMAAVVGAVDDGQLELPTPAGMRVGDVIDHVGTFAVRFLESARKDTDGQGVPPPADAAALEPGWRQRIAADLETMADAWGDPSAWEGTTRAGGFDLPAEMVGLIAVDELVVHGWDIAVATGQAFEPPADEVLGALTFVTAFAEVPRDGRLFGDVVPVADDAPAFERLLSLTGRDPCWHPGV